MKKFLVSVSMVALLAGCTAFSPPKAQYPSRDSITAGETITVSKSQNVYAIARAHNVPMRDLIVLNNLQPPFKLSVGQKLVLPTGYKGDGSLPAGGAVAEDMPAPTSSSMSTVQSETLPPIETAPLAPVKSAGITAPETRFVNAPKAADETLTPEEKAEKEAHALTHPSPPVSIETTASPAKAEQQVATASPPPAPSEPATPPPADAPAVSFVWPVQGPILSAYGPKGQGLNNDGINIGAPKGAPVVAAGSGIVVYAGNEMKGFGNLILIRHEGGWVTAYAHLDRMMVTKDAVVAQGDMIGTVGKTGNVASPQLHFETRFQGKPVDPNGVMKGS